MADKESRSRAITADPVAAWDGSAVDAQLIGQALLDALERRKGKLDRRMLQADETSQRILKLLD